MSIGDEVRKLERENEVLRDVADDIRLVHAALSDLLKIVVDIETRLGLASTENNKGSVREPTPEIETSHEYIVTEHGDDIPSLPYRVDAGQFIDNKGGS
jgi:hypothetical protein